MVSVLICAVAALQFSEADFLTKQKIANGTSIATPSDDSRGLIADDIVKDRNSQVPKVNVTNDYTKPVKIEWISSKDEKRSPCKAKRQHLKKIGFTQTVCDSNQLNEDLQMQCTVLYEKIVLKNKTEVMVGVGCELRFRKRYYNKNFYPNATVKNCTYSKSKNITKQ